MKKSHKKQLFNILFVLALAAFTVWTVSDMDLAAIKDFFAVCNPWFLIGALACMVGYFFFEGISLHLIIRRFGGKPRFRDPSPMPPPTCTIPTSLPRPRAASLPRPFI